MLAGSFFILALALSVTNAANFFKSDPDQGLNTTVCNSKSLI